MKSQSVLLRRQCDKIAAAAFVHLRRAAVLCIVACAPALANNGVVVSPNCDEAGFVSVFNTVDASGGGTITFSCGSSPVTISLTSYKLVMGTDIVDGGNAIIFDGANASAFFQISNNASLTLKNITLQHGAFNASHVLENFGSLTLSAVTIKDNVSTDTPIDNYGALNVISGTFSGNGITSAGTTQQGAALRNDGGSAQIDGTTFSNNAVNAGNSGEGGAIANSSGDLIVVSCTFSDNKAFDGGAVQISRGTAQIKNSTFQSNLGAYGGGIENDGGGVFVSNSTFTGNTASEGDGGAIWNLSGASTIDSSQFVGNHSNTTGGAISCYGDNGLTVTNSSFSANQSGTTGGALYNECLLTATNDTFNSNAAQSKGGGAIYGLSTQNSVVTYATIVGNTASFGAGIYNDDSNGGTLTVAKSIISANTGGNCDGVLISGGFNLANDMGCGGAFTASDRSNATLPLGTFANNGGPTSTLLPQAGNQGIDFIPTAQCGIDRDQRNAGRPEGSGCDSGAVEVNGLFDSIFASGFEF